jgi:2-polyprenyl-3-methyl-5-hydroxy-6-metoxy-1,4-benzoquinol methylase
MSQLGNTFSVNDIRPDHLKKLQNEAYQRDLDRLYLRLGEFSRVLCPACGGDQPQHKFIKLRCQFVECRNCETIYMSPRPTEAIMDEYYSASENYAIWEKYIFPASEASRRQNICVPNLSRIIETCGSLAISNPSILEIGPGFGTFSELAKKTGFFKRVTVIERTPEMAASCRSKGLEVVESTLEGFRITGAQIFDVAVCFEVIEHVFDPIEFLNAINRVLKSGGLLTLTCPNGAGFDTRTLQVASPAVDTEHVNLFNLRSIRILLERSGFEVVTVETPGSLDADIVRQAVLDGSVELSLSPFLKEILVDRFDELGGSFQNFLIEHRLSGNMRVFAVKT